MTSPIPGFWALVPAGGAGTRLWPLSRAGHPKFLHDLTGSGRSMLQATVDRLAPLAQDRVLVVTGAAHEAAVRAQLPELGSAAVLAEPSPRDSMAAIGYAAAIVERVDPDAVVGSFAADHVIGPDEEFWGCVRDAVECAREGHLVTIGIAPTHPSTAFGYIQRGTALPHGLASRVRQFVEKPDAERAAAYLATGEFRWNAGMFVVRAGVLLDLLARWHPDLARDLRRIAADPALLPELWPTLTRISIDHAVAEPAADAGCVVVVPGEFTWDDVGDFASLEGLLRADAADAAGAAGAAGAGVGPTVLASAPEDRSRVVAVDTHGLVVPAGGRVVAVVGLDDVVVVDTPDALLVTTRARAQDVKGVVDALRAAGRTNVL